MEEKKKLLFYELWKELKGTEHLLNFRKQSIFGGFRSP